MRKAWNHFAEKTLAVLLVAVMIAGMLPASIFAASTDGSDASGDAAALSETVSTDSTGTDVADTGTGTGGTDVDAGDTDTGTGTGEPASEPEPAPEQVWPGALVLDLNMPDDWAWNKETSTGELTIGMEAEQSQQALGEYQEGETVDLTEVIANMKELTLDLPVTYANGTSGGIRAHVTGLSYDKEGTQPVDPEYIVGSEPSQVLYVNWDWGEVSYEELDLSAVTPDTTIEDGTIVYANGAAPLAEGGEEGGTGGGTGEGGTSGEEGGGSGEGGTGGEEGGEGGEGGGEGGEEGEEPPPVVGGGTLGEPSANPSDSPATYTSHIYTFFWDYGYTGSGVTSSQSGVAVGWTNKSVNFSGHHSGPIGSIMIQSHWWVYDFTYPQSPERVGWLWLGWFNDGEDAEGNFNSVALELLNAWYKRRMDIVRVMNGPKHLKKHFDEATKYSMYWSGDEMYKYVPCTCDLKDFTSEKDIKNGTTFTALWMAAPIIWHSMGGEWNYGESGLPQDPVKTAQPFDNDVGVTSGHYESNTTAGGHVINDHDRLYPGDPTLAYQQYYGVCQTYVHNGFLSSEEEYVPIVVSPIRLGYTFNGWYFDAYCQVPITEFETGIQPRRHYYAGWQAEEITIEYYDTRESTGPVQIQTSTYHDVIDLLTGYNDTAGWHYVGWATAGGQLVATGINSELQMDFFSGTKNGKDPQWCYAFMEKIAGGNANPSKNINGDYVGNDYIYYHAAKGDTDSDQPGGNGSFEDTYDNEGRWVVRLYAVWEEDFTDYTLKIVWNDIQNNDGCRPKTLTFGLVDSYMNNEVIKTNTLTVDPVADEENFTIFTHLHVQDNDDSLQKRQYKLVFLGYTDYWGEKYTMKSPAIDGDKGLIDLQTISTGSDHTLTQYAYGLNNYGPSDGYNGGSVDFEPGTYHSIITFDHALIDTGDDIKFTIQWDDDGDNDGKRPGAVMLVLYADDGSGPMPVYQRPWENHKFGKDSVSASLCEVTDDGNTWTYIFPNYERYHDGKAIQYSVAIKNDDLNSTFDKDEYKVRYLNPVSEVAGSPDGCIVSRAVHMEEVPVRIVWDDENNRDGQRPEYVTVALMANQWNDHTFRWESEEIATQVVRTGGANTMTASEWTATFGSQKVYNDGLRRVYHMVVLSDLNQFIPEGSFEYGWTEDLYGNQRLTAEDYVNIQRRNPVAQVRIGQNTNTVSVTGNIYWDDSQNNDNIRPTNVVMQLYSHAPGRTPEPVPGEAYRVTLTGDPTADNWYYTFSGMPKYAEGQSGVELVYTIKIEEVDGEPLYGYYIITANGEEEEVLRYEASYLFENPDGMGAEGDTENTLDFNKSDRAYVRLRHVCETKTMNFSVNWHDGDNRDDVRPVSVMAELYKTIGNGEPIYIETIDISAGKADTWTYKITNLVMS